MARLAHPNVVAVHDVGTVGDEVFVAMELVEGPTLAAWLAAEAAALARGAGRASLRPAAGWPRPTPPAWSTATSSPPT